MKLKWEKGRAECAGYTLDVSPDGSWAVLIAASGEVVADFVATGEGGGEEAAEAALARLLAEDEGLLALLGLAELRARVAELEAERAVFVAERVRAMDADTPRCYLARAYGMTGNYVQSAEEMIRRIGDLLGRAVKADPIMARMHGYLPTGEDDPTVALMDRIVAMEGLRAVDIAITQAAHGLLVQRIAEMEAAQRWIPVGERLPDSHRYSLAWDGDGMVFATVDSLGQWWSFTRRLPTPEFWRPLPAGPEAQSVQPARDLGPMFEDLGPLDFGSDK